MTCIIYKNIFCFKKTDHVLLQRLQIKAFSSQFFFFKAIYDGAHVLICLHWNHELGGMRAKVKKRSWWLWMFLSSGTSCSSSTDDNSLIPVSCRIERVPMKVHHLLHCTYFSLSEVFFPPPLPWHAVHQSDMQPINQHNLSSQLKTTQQASL